MQTLTDRDLRFIASRIPADVRDLMGKKHVWLGGGFIRATIAGERPSDIDLFGADKATLDHAADKLVAARYRARRHETENAISVYADPRLPVQFITRWLFPSPEEVLRSFDFTIAQAIIWCDAGPDGKIIAWHSSCADDFYADLAARRLVYTFPQRNEDAGGSLMRVRKFLKRGYSIQAQALAGTIARLMGGVEFHKLPERGGRVSWEAALTHVIAGLLREVDPNVVVDGLPVDEHEVEASVQIASTSVTA